MAASRESPPGRRSPAVLLSAAILPALLGAPAAGGEKDEYRPITPEEIEARSFRPGEKRTVTGKYQELINTELRLADVEARFLVNLPALGRALLDLKPMKDNVALRGSFLGEEEARRSSPAGARTGEDQRLPVFQVDRVETAPADAVLFEERLRETLGRASTAEEVAALGERMAARARRFSDPALVPLARQAFKEAFLKADASLPENDAGGRLALLRRIHAAVQDQALVLEILKARSRLFEDHAPTLAFLAELKCYRLGGEWLPYDAYKRKLGFVLHDGSWVKPARKELLLIAAQLLKENLASVILRGRTDGEYQILAKAGKVEKGMTREELNDALGLPDRVERRAVKDGLEVDQWNYGDRRVYLLNGQVLAMLP